MSAASQTDNNHIYSPVVDSNELKKWYVTQKYNARVGVFTDGKYTTRYNTGLSWGHLGVIDTANNRCVYFLGPSVERNRVMALQLRYSRSTPTFADCNQFTLQQQATLHDIWCPEVSLGEERWTKFIAQDPTIKDELARLIDVLRRCDNIGRDDNTTVYDADELLSDYDTLITTNDICW